MLRALFAAPLLLASTWVNASLIHDIEVDDPLIAQSASGTIEFNSLAGNDASGIVAFSLQITNALIPSAFPGDPGLDFGSVTFTADDIIEAAWQHDAAGLVSFTLNTAIKSSTALDRVALYLNWVAGDGLSLIAPSVEVFCTNESGQRYGASTLGDGSQNFLRNVDALFVVGCADNDLNGNAGGFTEFINVPDRTVTVPEPSAALLLGLALPLLVLWHRQRAGRARGRLIVARAR